MSNEAISGQRIGSSSASAPPPAVTDGDEARFAASVEREVDPPSKKTGGGLFGLFRRGSRDKADTNGPGGETPGTEGDAAAWPPKGSTPYTGNAAYYPNGDMIPYEQLAQMPDGSVYYRSNGKETLGALVTMAAQFEPSGMRNRTAFIGLNTLPIVLDDRTVPFKDGQTVKMRPGRVIEPPAPAKQEPVIKIAEVQRDHDRYIEEDIRRSAEAPVGSTPRNTPAKDITRPTEPAVDHDNYFKEEVNRSNVAKAMDIIKSNPLADPARDPLVGVAHATLEEQFGKPYADRMVASAQAEFQQAMLKRQGTIDLPFEEKQAQARAAFLAKLDEDWGALSPVMRFFMPTYAMPDMGFAPSPIELITDIGVGAHFSRAPSGTTFRRGNQSLARYNTNDRFTYFVTEPDRVRYSKPAKPGDYVPATTVEGKPVWLPKSSSTKVPTTEADRAMAWVEPSYQAQKAPVTAKRNGNGSGEAVSDKTPAGKTASSAKKTTPPTAAPQGTTTSKANTQPEEQRAVMTSDGTVKVVDPKTTTGTPSTGGGTRPNIGDETRVNLYNVLQPGDPALKGYEKLAGGNGPGTEPKIFGAKRSANEPDKVLLATGKDVTLADVKKAYGEETKVTERTVGANKVFTLEIPHPAVNTGAKGGGLKMVEPNAALESMTGDVHAHTIDDISQPRGRVNDRVNAANSLYDQVPTVKSGDYGKTQEFAVEYHTRFAKARTQAADALQTSRQSGNPYFANAEDMVRTLDGMNVTQTKDLYKDVNPGAMRREDRLRYLPGPMVELADVEAAAKKYGQPYRLTESVGLGNPFESARGPVRMTPAIDEATWNRHNPGLPYDAKLVNPWYQDGPSWMYAGTKLTKPGEPGHQRAVQYEQAVVKTYQQIAWEKGRDMMNELQNRNNMNPAENAAEFNRRDDAVLQKLGEHAYYLMNARKYDAGNASVYMNEVNMLLRSAGYDEVPHGVLDHAAYRFSPEAFSRYFTDWVRSNQ